MQAARTRLHVSERRACKVLGQVRSTQSGTSVLRNRIRIASEQESSRSPRSMADMATARSRVSLISRAGPLVMIVSIRSGAKSVFRCLKNSLKEPDFG